MAPRLLLLLPLAMALCTRSAPAASPTTKPIPEAKLSSAQVESHVKSLIDAGYCPGIVVGVIDSSGPNVYGFGVTARQNGKKPDGDSLFEIGSVTKIFTATVFAQMLHNNEVTLEQAADSIVKDMKIPAEGGSKIWLMHLATHTSGLPLHPSNLQSPSLDNPYFGYTQDRLERFLAEFMLPRTPGDRCEYSHVGYSLLAQAMARKENKSVEQLLHDRVCSPLQLKDTRFTLPADAKARSVSRYTIDGDEVDAWHCPPMEGAFGLHSTANDLLKIAAAHLDPEKSPFPEVVKSMHLRQVDVDRYNDMAIGWQIGRRFNNLWINGETGGCHVFVTVMPKNKAAVVLLANTATTLIDLIGANLVRVLSGEQYVPPMQVKVAQKIDPAILDQYVGEYQVDHNQSLFVTRQGDHLYINAKGQLKLKLYAENKTTFFGKSVQRMVEFVRSPTGAVEGLFFHQGAKPVPAKKIS